MSLSWKLVQSDDDPVMSANAKMLHHAVGEVIASWYNRSGLPDDERLSIIANILMHQIYLCISGPDVSRENALQIIGRIWDLCEKDWQKHAKKEEKE